MLHFDVKSESANVLFAVSVMNVRIIEYIVNIS